jgi:hypothetical protein
MLKFVSPHTLWVRSLCDIGDVSAIANRLSYVMQATGRTLALICPRESIRPRHVPLPYAEQVDCAA